MIFKNLYLALPLSFCQVSSWPMLRRANNAGVTKINWTLLVLFVKNFATSEFQMFFTAEYLENLYSRGGLHARIGASMRAILAVLIEKSHCRASQQYSTTFPLNWNWVFWALCKKGAENSMCVTSSLLTFSEWDRLNFHLFFGFLNVGNVHFLILKRT